MTFNLKSKVITCCKAVVCLLFLLSSAFVSCTDGGQDPFDGDVVADAAGELLIGAWQTGDSTLTFRANGSGELVYPNMHKSVYALLGKKSVEGDSIKEQFTYSYKNDALYPQISISTPDKNKIFGVMELRNADPDYFDEHTTRYTCSILKIYDEAHSYTFKRAETAFEPHDALSNIPAEALVGRWITPGAELEIKQMDVPIKGKGSICLYYGLSDNGSTLLPHHAPRRAYGADFATHCSASTYAYDASKHQMIIDTADGERTFTLSLSTDQMLTLSEVGGKHDKLSFVKKIRTPQEIDPSTFIGQNLCYVQGEQVVQFCWGNDGVLKVRNSADNSSEEQSLFYNYYTNNRTLYWADNQADLKAWRNVTPIYIMSASKELVQIFNGEKILYLTIKK